MDVRGLRSKDRFIGCHQSADQLSKSLQALAYRGVQDFEAAAAAQWRAQLVGHVAVETALFQFGEGHLDQSRFKSFPIQDDAHFLVVCRYVERNALRAGLVKKAEDWEFGSLWRWLQKPEPSPQLLSPWPIRRSPDWVARVNEPLTEQEREAVRRSVQRDRPFGDEDWTQSIADRLGLWSTIRPRGRPRKKH